MSMELPSLQDVAGANVPFDPEDPRDDFAFLDGVDEDNCYMPIDTQRPSKSYDFGADGYTGSITTWHELLQLTAPDKNHGIVFVRGDFPDSPNSILARAQRRNPKGTFGLGVYVADKAPKQEQGKIATVLEQTAAHGLINMRWPCTRLNYVQNDEHGLPDIVADYTACSFVKGGTVYQVVRISPRAPGNGGTSPAESIDSGESGTIPRAIVDITINTGGLVRFGSSRSLVPDDGPHWPVLDTYSEETPPPGDGPCYAMACKSERLGLKLEMRLWINREPMDVRKTRCCGCKIKDMNRLAHTPDKLDTNHKHDVFWLQAVWPWQICRDAINVVAAFSLVPADQKINFETEIPMISNSELQNYIGLSSSSPEAPYRLWSYINGQAPGVEALELNATGRCAEAILGVSAVPVPELPLTNKKDANQRPRIALIKNIMAAQVVDFESLFWQIRFLVKVLKCLSHRHLPHPDTRSRASRFQTIADVDAPNEGRNIIMFLEYKARLLTALEGICRWILAAVPLLGRTSSVELVGGVLPSEVDLVPVSPLATELPKGLLSGSRERRSLSVKRERRAETERAKQKFRMRSQRWYCAMIIWFLFIKLPPECIKDDMKEQLWTAIRYLASEDPLNRFRNQDNRTDTAILDDAYGCILRWYHSFSVWELCKHLEQVDTARFASLHINTTKHRDLSHHWQAKAEKSLRLFGQGRLLRQILDHEVAYLVLVGKELNVDQGPRIQLGVNHTCLYYVTKLIDERPGTTTLYPGASRVSRWDAADVRSAVKRPAPWELNCLAHHVPLCFDIYQEREEEIMQKCWQFLLSDCTFHASLDPCRTNMVCLWWDLTASAIICTKLLDETDYTLKHRGSWAAEDSIRGSETPRSGLIPPRLRTVQFQEPRKESLGPKRPEAIPVVRKRRGPLFVEKADNEQLKKRYAEGFIWERRLPLVLFHPDSAVQSLGNHPDLFGVSQTKDVFLRLQIEKRFQRIWEREPTWTLTNIKSILTAQALRHISCVDLGLGMDTNGRPEIMVICKKGRIQCAETTFWADIIERTVPGLTPDMIWIMGKTMVEAINKTPGLLNLYFTGKHKKHPKFKELPDETKTLLRQDPVRREFLKAYQSSLLTVLNDNLVDLGTRYRLMFVRDFTPKTMRAMVYMWHPDALDTLDSCLGKISQFVDLEQQAPRGGEDIWVSSITLSHWRLEDRSETEIRTIQDNGSLSSRLTSAKKKALALKDRISGWFSRLFSRDDTNQRDNRGPGHKSRTRCTDASRPHGGHDDTTDNDCTDGTDDPTSSRCVASTATLAHDDDGDAMNEKGKKSKNKDGKPGDTSGPIDFPPPTVPDVRKYSSHPYHIRELSVSLVMTGDWGRYWTCTVISELISAHTALQYTTQVQSIMQMFIHQPYTGRLLVFLLLLSYLCETLAVECDRFVDELDQIMEMDTMVLLRGMPWSKSDVVLKKLKRMLWGLEALRIFSDKLGWAESEINRAKEKAGTWMLVGHDLRHRDMERERQRVVEEFEKRRERLVLARRSIMQRIEQGGRLREGISSVIGVEQNENISMLTWVTIAYLPLAFVAGLFSMDHVIVPLDGWKDKGWKTFGWLNVVFLTGTVIFALTLQYWINSFRHMSTGVQNLLSDTGNDLLSFRSSSRGRDNITTETGTGGGATEHGSGTGVGFTRRIGQLFHRQGRQHRPHELDEEAGGGSTASGRRIGPQE